MIQRTLAFRCFLLFLREDLGWSRLLFDLAIIPIDIGLYKKEAAYNKYMMKKGPLYFNY